MNLRLGYTESTLLLYYYLDSLNIDNNCYKNHQNNLINWLCTTSGYYDKSIRGNYFNFNGDTVKLSKVYNRYFSKLLAVIKKWNSSIILKLHQTSPVIESHRIEFLEMFNQSNINFFDFIRNRRILIINNLGSLMKMQYKRGILNKIYPDFPNIKKIMYLHNGYTFFNKGPDKSILKTAKKLCKQINEYNFDCAVISAGAYSLLFANYIIDIMGKDVYVIGGDLPLYFGIKTKRIIDYYGDRINEYFISVPEKLKPDNYMKIENGCYW